MNHQGLVKQVRLLVTVTSFALLCGACAKEAAPTLTISTGGSGGRYQVVGRALVRVAYQNQAAIGAQLDYKTSSGSVANINAIGAGEADFGIAQSDHLFQAISGVGEWADAGPQTELRAVFGMYTESVTLVAGGDSGIQSIADLQGKVVDIGPEGSGTRANAIDALSAAGINWQAEIDSREENLDSRLTSFMHGELDAFFYTAGHPNSDIKFATFSVRGAQIIPLTNIATILEQHPYYLQTTIPAGLYPMARNNSDVETIGVSATLLTSASVPEEVVYSLTKALFEDQDALVEFSAEFAALVGDDFLNGITAPLHPGAARYYQEVGIDVPAR